MTSRDNIEMFRGGFRQMTIYPKQPELFYTHRVPLLKSPTDSYSLIVCALFKKKNLYIQSRTNTSLFISLLKLFQTYKHLYVTIFCALLVYSRNPKHAVTFFFRIPFQYVNSYNYPKLLFQETSIINLVYLRKPYCYQARAKREGPKGPRVRARALAKFTTIH